ncbi:hypothetical protein [Sphingomonas sp. LaA6.9]|uniref:hypothetical protein n=1 Tax=Sphingomonas sp. LaA6.9 TaxID=2919914 RepID=UPI001F501C91|nr:hypothetical protein [Sphingomonas sp. LaA6.9]MCJ8158551.1 hypothetical protein [Sphingomonas sp. LaA6.9]
MPFSGSSREGAIGTSPPHPESGTALAIYTSSKSARPFDAKHGFSGWGGARNSTDRTSVALTLRQASGIIEAAQFAYRVGLLFNRHVTIHLERAGVSDSEAAAAIGAFLTLARDWFRKQGKRTAWAWVRENGDGKGSHVHILLHVPVCVKWSGWRLRRWLERITGKPYQAGIIQTARIGGTTRAAATAPAAYQANLAAVVAYVIKGASPDAARALGLERLEDGGRIIGKRAGWSQNVGLSARCPSS